MQEELKLELLQARIDVQQHFYNRLATSLHDKVGQLLGSVNILLGVAMKDLVLMPDALNTAQASLRTAIQELRTLARSMEGGWIEQFNILEQLQQEIIMINAAGAGQVKLVAGKDDLPASPDKQAIIFCALVEILRDMTSGAQVKEITVEILCNPHLEIMIGNNGPAPYPIPVKVQQRITALDGTFRQVQTPGRNTLYFLFPV